MRTIITLAVAALAATAAAADDGVERFTHQGTTYIYSTTHDHGRTVISGHQLPSNEPFRLVVDGAWVTGTSGGQPVSFRTASAKGAAAEVLIAAN